MERSCDACGEVYEAATRRSKFCSKRCRSRAARGFRPPVTVAAARPVVEAPKRGEVHATTLAELERFGRVNTPLGAAALTLAARIDEGGDTASGLASLTGRWMEALAKACDGARDQVDPLDDLQRQRLRRLGVVGA